MLNEIFVVAPEQMVADGGVAATFGIGLTVITTACGVPVHPAATGVTVYVAVPGAEPVVRSDWLMGPATGAATVPTLVAPTTPACTTVQKYAVPGTPFGVLKAMAVFCPEQIV